MTIFGRSSYSYNIPVVEGYGVEVNGDILAIQESYDDQLAIIEAMYEIDMTEIEYRSQGQENSVVCEATIKDKAKNAWEKIKAFFKKLWAKLKAFFESMKRFVNGLFMSGYKFAQKYKSQLEKLKLSGFKYEMFEYTNLDEEIDLNNIDSANNYVKEMVDKIKQSSIEKGKQVITELREMKDEHLNETRGFVVGKSPLTSEEFKEEIYRFFRGGKTVKTMQSVNINEVIKALLNKSQIKSVENLTKKIDNDLKDGLSKIDELKNASDKDKQKESLYLEFANILSPMFRNFTDVQLEMIRAWKDALVERNNVYKKVCIAAFRHKEDK